MKKDLTKIVLELRGDFFARIPSLLKEIRHSYFLLINSRLTKTKKENLQELIRQIHSLKASLNLLQFSKEAKLAHKIEENLLCSDSKSKYSFEDIQKLLSILEKLSIKENFPKTIKNPNYLSDNLEKLLEIKSKKNSLFEYKISNFDLLQKFSKLKSTKLLAVFIQLINNSIDHGFANSKLKSKLITIDCRETLKFHIIEFRDNGVGIKLKSKTDTINQIFKPGFTTETTANLSSGRGYGLSIASQNLSEINAKISCKQQSKGAHFIVKIKKEI